MGGLTQYQVPSQRIVCHLPGGVKDHAVPWLWGPRHRPVPLFRWVLGRLVRHMALGVLREAAFQVALAPRPMLPTMSVGGSWLEGRRPQKLPPALPPGSSTPTGLLSPL